MAKIPSAEELGVANPGSLPGTAGSASITFSGNDAALGARQMLAEEKERIDNRQLGEARVQLQLATIAADARYEQDDDLDTIQMRYDSDMKEQLAMAAGVIEDGELRDAFVMDSQVAVASAQEKMRSKVTARQNDREKGHMTNAIAEIVRGTLHMEEGAQGLSTGEQLTQGIIAIQTATESMVERGVITEVEAQTMVRQAQNDMAMGKLQMMSGEDQLAALEEDWASNLPPQILGQLQQEAERKHDDELAHSQALAMKDMDYGAGLAMLQEAYADDPDMYELSRARFAQLKQDEKAAKQELQEDFYNDYFFDVRSGTIKVSDIPNLRDAGLNSKQLNALHKAEADAALQAAGDEYRKFSDPEVVQQLDQYIGNNQLVEARQYFSENFDRLTGGPNGDMYYYRGMLTKKGSDPEFKPVRTARQLLKDFEEKHGKLSKDENFFMWERLQQKQTDYIRANQKEPTDQQMNDWIREEFYQVRRTNTFFDDNDLVHELSPERRMQYDRQVSAIQALLGSSREAAANAWSGYTQEQYDAIDDALTALPQIRKEFPNLDDRQLWSLITTTLIGQPGDEIPQATPEKKSTGKRSGRGIGAQM